MRREIVTDAKASNWRPIMNFSELYHLSIIVAQTQVGLEWVSYVGSKKATGGRLFRETHDGSARARATTPWRSASFYCPPAAPRSGARCGAPVPGRSGRPTAQSRSRRPRATRARRAPWTGPVRAWQGSMTDRPHRFDVLAKLAATDAVSGKLQQVRRVLPASQLDHALDHAGERAEDACQ